jgi:2-polyprenyl-6-methoxyphenol hydroxylase-like FAD-dependent oxidoreductase
MNVLISGGGIAGLAAALFLGRQGHHVRVIDRAPSFRKAGYAISLKGFGIQLMADLGLRDALRRHALSYDRLCLYDSDARPLQVLSDELVEKITHGQVFTYRSELHAVLHEAACSALPPMGFGVHVTALDGDERGTRVTLSDGTVEDFDLVVVAEGMRSTTRNLLWGSEGQRPLDVVYAAATIDVAHGLDPRGAHGYFGESHNAAFLPIDDRRLLVQCYWRARLDERPSSAAARTMLVETFRGFGPGVRRFLEAIAPDGDVFCDAVSMIVLPSRVRERVVLLGDAGYCPTFLSGMGASLGLLGAKLLSLCLPLQGGDVAAGLKRYDDTLRPVVEHFQANALANVDNALPTTHLKAVVRAWAMHLLPASLLARHFGKQFDVEEKLLHGIV